MCNRRHRAYPNRSAIHFTVTSVAARDRPAIATFPTSPLARLVRSLSRQRGLNIKTPTEFCAHSKIISLLEKQVTELTQELAKYEKVKKIALLSEELTVDGGELTPTLKVKRRVVNEKYKDVIEKIYADAEKQK